MTTQAFETNIMSQKNIEMELIKLKDISYNSKLSDEARTEVMQSACKRYTFL